MRPHRLLFLVLCVLLTAFTVTAQVVAPPPPTNLTAELIPAATGGVKLMWNHASNIFASFRVYRSTGDTLNFVPRGTTSTRNFYDYQVQPGETYFYYVTAFINHNGTTLESGRSNYAHVTIGVPPPRPKGVIAGTVIDDSTGLPIKNVLIRFFRVIAPSMHVPFAKTDSLGHYSAQLDTGRYFVKAEGGCNAPTPALACGYKPEWYDNAPTPTTATPVVVGDNTLFVANFGLSPIPMPSYAYVNGRVTDTLGAPIRHASVALMRTIQEMNMLTALMGTPPGGGNEAMFIDGLGHTHGVIWRGFTDSLGNYRARVISGRTYIAVASKFGFMPRYFDNKPTPQLADIIAVSGDTSGINFTLPVNPNLQNSISGSVKDSLGNGIPSRIVLLPLHNTITPSLAHYRHTDSLGNFTINNVWSGRYFVRAIPFTGYAPAFYKAGAYGVTNRADADTVHITGAVTGIDVGVVPILSNGIARVTGRIRATNGAWLEGAIVVARNSAGVVGIGFTDRSGNYVVEAVSSGEVIFEATLDGFTRAQSTVTIGGTVFNVNNVDYTLAPEGVTSVTGGLTPDSYELGQNYPNPFNPATTIAFSIPVNGMVSLRIYNVLGQEVATLVNELLPAGTHRAVWSGHDQTRRQVSSGIYFYRMHVTPAAGGPSYTQSNRMVLVK